MAKPRLTLWHMPQSRSTAMLWLLEEAGADYAIEPVTLTLGADRARLRAVNPKIKVPTLVDHGPDGTWSSVITETTAIAGHVAELFPQAGLAPPLGDPQRGPWWTWLVLRAAALEPAFADALNPRAQPPARGTTGWRGFADEVARIEAALADGRAFLLGERLSAPDVLIGALLFWARGTGQLQPTGPLAAYLERLAERPARARAMARDGSRAGG